MKWFRRDTLEYEFLPSALEIEQTPPSPLGSLTIWVIFVLITGTILWSYFAMVDEVVAARGKIVADGRVKVIQPLEEGIIRNIHVTEGQSVNKGDLLVELDSTVKQAEVANYEKMLTTARLEKEMLTAMLANQDIAQVMNKKSAFDKKLVDLQFKLLQTRQLQYQAQQEQLQHAIREADTQISLAQTQLSKLHQRNQQLEKQLADLLRASKAPGTTITQEIITAKDKELQIAKSEWENQKLQVELAERQKKEAEVNLRTFENEKRQILLNEILDKEKTITMAQNELVKAQKQYELQSLYAPDDGIILSLSTTTTGGVVTPAQQVVTLVPKNTPLIVEANIKNQDIGFVKEGMETEIKLDTFPFQKYGMLKGKISSISPDAYEDPALGAVYKMKIQLDTSSLLVNGQAIPLRPGMSLTVEAKTGKKRIIEFFLAPILKSLNESLRMR